MAEVSLPWSGTTTGDAGAYSADQWARAWRGMFSVGNGVGAAANSGIIWGTGANPDPGLSVTPNSPGDKSVLVTAGGAIVHGTFYFNSATVTLAVAANTSGNPRIDTVVLRKSWAAQTVRLVVKQGTPAASPVPPGMTQSDTTTWEIPLCDILLANGYVSVTAADLTPRLLYKNVAVLDTIENVQNASGVTVNAGDVAVWGTSARQVTSSAVQGVGVAGVWADRVVNGGYGRIVRRGIFPVRMSAAVATLYAPVIHAANFVASVVASGASQHNAFAVTLETTAGAGRCLCYIDVTMPHPKVADQTSYNTPADITSATTAGFADVDTTNLKITFTTNTGKVKTTFRVPTYFVLGGAGSAWMYFNLELDATTKASAAAGGLMCPATYASGGAGAADRALSQEISFVWEGLTPGEHTVRLQWNCVLGAGTLPTMGIRQYNANAGHPVYMIAEELDG